MTDKVLHTIKRYQMLAPGDQVLIGLSGGADSMALAFFMNQIKEAWNLSLLAVHVNHCLRGEEAQRDANFVASWCAEEGIPCRIIRKDVAAAAKKWGVGVELAGRRVRYETFASFGTGYQIATAHHLNDAIESALLHLVRGASLDGIRGIAPVRGQVIRPLIQCTRADIMAYCTAHKIPYVTDSSNLQDAFARNRIRNRVVPELKAVNPSLEEAFDRFFTLTAEDSAYLEQQAEAAYAQVFRDGALDCSTLNGLPPAMQGRIIRFFLVRQCSFTPEHKHVLAVAAVAQNGGQVQLQRDLILRRFKGVLRVVPAAQKPCSFQIMNKLVLTREEFLNISKIEKNSFHFCADYDKIKGNVSVRSRQAGDTIAPAGRNGTKTLKKYLNEMGIPRENRDAVPVITDEDGLIGLAGLACHCRVAPDEGTKRFFLMKVEEKDA